MLSADDPITPSPRVTIAGVSGSGKSTLAREIARRWRLPYHEIDALYHGAGWQPRAEFVDDVTGVLAQPAWVMEWQYSDVREQIAERAELLIWLDLPTVTTMRQLIGRTISRRLRRTELWNGNQEAPLWTLFTDPEHIIRWGWQTRNLYRQRIPLLALRHPHLTIVHLRSGRQRDRWLAGLVQN